MAAHFRNDSRALYSLETAAVAVDRSHWGRLRLSGTGCLAFLHGQTTNDIAALRPGEGCDTVRDRLAGSRYGLAATSPAQPPPLWLLHAGVCDGTGTVH